MRPESVALRVATPVDVPALTSLVNSAYRGESSRVGWTTEADLLGGQRTDEAALQEFIGGASADPHARVMLIAIEADAPLACVQLERRGDLAYLGMLTVAPARQSSGLGRRLLEAAEREVIRRWSVRGMMMTVIAQRAELIDWYERRGYRRSGATAPFPYGDERFGLPRRLDLHFVVLEKSLTTPNPSGYDG